MKLKLIIAYLVTLISLSVSAQNYQKALNIYQQDPDKALALLKKDLTSSDKETQANASNLMGYIESSRSNYNEAIIHFYRAADINLLEKNNNKLSDNYNRIGSEYYHLRDYAKAKKLYLMAMEIGDKNDEYLYHNLGTVYQRLNKFDSAIHYLTPARLIAMDKENTTLLFDILCEIGHAYFHSQNYEKAVYWYNDLYLFSEKEGNEKYKKFAYINIGNTYHDAGEYAKAIEHLELALPIDQNEEALVAYLNLAECYKEINQNGLSIQYFNKAIDSYTNPSQTSDYLSAHNQIIDLYVKSEDLQNVSVYAARLTTLVTQITNENNSIKTRANLLMMEHQAKKRELEFQIKKRDEEVKIWGIVSMILMAFIGGLAYFKVPQMIIYRYNLIKKQNDELKKTVGQLRELRD